MTDLNPYNFWCNGKIGAILDSDGKVLVSFDKVFHKHYFTPEIKEALEKYGIDMKVQRILTNETLEDALFNLDLHRYMEKIPLKHYEKENFEALMKQKLDKFLNEK
jgi:hypothetical protein